MKKSVKNIAIVLAVVMIFSSCLSLNAFAAGNYYDSDYSTGIHRVAAPDIFTRASSAVNINKNGFKEYNAYGIRQKLDTTGTYVYNKSGASFMFIVVGCTQANGGSLYPNDTKKAGRIDVGQERRIRQWVYENGHAYCMLYAASIFNNSASRGVWSPDCIGGYAYAND